jgi:transposase
MLPEWKHVPPTELDQQIFDTLVPPQHYLRQVKAVIDFERFRPAMAECYSASMGRPACDPVLMLKLSFLRFQYNLSDRRVIEDTRVNVAYRYFADLSLKSELPHHTTFDYFRDRLGPEKFQTVFADVVAQAREHGLVKDRLRLKDATHVIANIAIPSTIRLVADTRERLLDAAEPLDPEWAARQRHQAEAVRASTVDLSDEERLLQRVTHLRQIVAEAEALLEQLAPPVGNVPDPRRAHLEEAVRLARKVLDDRDDPDAKGKVVSAHDPDARNGWHHQWFAGYLLDVAMDADSEIITALNVLPANGNEGADASTLIEQEESAHGNDVEQLSIDGAGFRGPLLREWTDPNGLNLEVIVPPPPPQETKGFPPNAFTQDADGTLHCPAGQTTHTRERNDDTGWKYRFSAATCAGCPLRTQCLNKPDGTTGRTVIKNDYEAEYEAARAKAQTPEYERVRREHPKIERKLNEMVRWHRARRAQGRGLPRVLMQALWTGIVVNVKRIVKLLAPPGTAAETVRAELVAQT